MVCLKSARACETSARKHIPEPCTRTNFLSFFEEAEKNGKRQQQQKQQQPKNYSYEAAEEVRFKKVDCELRIGPRCQQNRN